MKLFNTYPRFDITLERAKGSFVYDSQGNKYLDLYGGHGVISIGHNHPHYVESLKDQLDKIGFYSNSVNMPMQTELASKLGKLSGYTDYEFFMVNSGAEANENALKLASFHTGKRKIIAFKGSFHGRTAAALTVTDNQKLLAPINTNSFEVAFVEMNDEIGLKEEIQKGDIAAVIIEGIQGVGGLDRPSSHYLQFLENICQETETILILDEIQAGYGRSGRFFAHQHAGIRADIITTAKGMGNGFPIGGVLISPKIEATYGMLGTTFGGNHLACAAGLAVLEVLEDDELMKNAERVSDFLIKELSTISAIKQIKGLGLMLGVELEKNIKQLRTALLMEKQIFTGNSANPNLLRILPPLNITVEEITPFVESLKELLK